MQEHHQEPQLEHRQELPPEHCVPRVSAFPISGQNPPDSATYADTRLEVYLDAICALMPAHVPADALADMRREMRDHLQATFSAYGELEHEPEDALALTLAQFGEPRIVAKHWRQEWEKTLANAQPARFWPSLKLSLKVWTATHAALLGVWLYGVTQASSRHVSFWLMLVSSALFLGPPIGAGAFIGLRARCRPVVCALSGYALTLPIVAVGVLLYVAFMRFWEPPHHLQGLGTSAYPLWFKIMVGVVFYTWMTLPLGFAGASVTALGRSIRTYMMRRQIAV